MAAPTVHPDLSTAFQKLVVTHLQLLNDVYFAIEQLKRDVAATPALETLTQATRAVERSM